MDKIRQILLKTGLSEDAANAAITTLEDYARGLREHYQKEFNSKLAEVKEACLAETQNHKVELSRRVQVFLEAKEESVHQQLQKQAAERGTAAEAKLERIASVCEGIQLDGQPNAELQAEVGKRDRIIKSLKEQADLAVKKANRLQEVADKVLKRNRLLEGQIATKGNKKTVAESVQRQGGRPVTTRRVLEENVEPAPRRQQQQAAAPQQMTLTPDAIADLI